MHSDGGRVAARILDRALGRRGFLQAVAAVGGGVGIAGVATVFGKICPAIS